MTEYIVERIHDGIVVLEREDRSKLELSKETIACPVKEGDVVLEHDGVYTVDLQKTRNRREYLAKRTQSLFKKQK